MSITRSKFRCRRTWHPAFLELLPRIEAYAVPAFRYLGKDDREDAVQETVAQAFLGFVVLMTRGRPELIFPTVLARYAIGRVRQGRTFGSPLNSCDVLSRPAQRRRGFAVQRLDQYDSDAGAWFEAIVEDTRTPVVDQAAFRVDFPAWLERLSRRNRRIAESLAYGHTTKAVARKFRVTPGRISQLRRELHASWEEFHKGMESVEPQQLRDNQNLRHRVA
jgi:DNA-directed RNA polymerase specialized sigma24 family protein